MLRYLIKLEYIYNIVQDLLKTRIANERNLSFTVLQLSYRKAVDVSM